MSNLTTNDLIGMVRTQEKEIFKLQGRSAALLTLLAATTLDPKPSLEKVKETANQLVRLNSDAQSASNETIQLLEEARKILAS